MATLQERLNSLVQVVGADVKNLNTSTSNNASNITSLQSLVGTSASLNTTNKTIVGAINEVKGAADDNATTIGTLSDLTTNAKSNLIAAINEVDANTDTNTTTMGALTSLQTSVKTNLVAAINEVKGQVDNINIGAVIDDNAAPTITAKTYSAQKVTELIKTAKDEILGGAGDAYDTLLEIQQALTGDGSAVEGVLRAVAGCVRFDKAQSLSTANQKQARDNIGLEGIYGNPDTDLVAIYNAAKA